MNWDRFSAWVDGFIAAGAPPVGSASVKDSGVMLTSRRLCPPRDWGGVSERTWESILTEFARRRDIDFACPTQRFYDNRLEGNQSRAVAADSFGGVDG